MPYEKVGNSDPVCIADEVPFEIPDSWEWVRLGSILYKLSDGTHSTPKYVEHGIPFISVKDVSSGCLDFSNCKYIAEKEHAELYERCNPEKGDILLTKVGTTGIPVIVDTDKEFSLFVSVALLKFNQNLLYNEYLIHLINSPLVQKQAAENTKGVGNKNWVMRDIANTLVVIPPLNEQYRIVEEFKKYNKFLLEYSKKESELSTLNTSFPELLKKSILQEAVQGKLAPQDENDESASVLLERIRQEKDALVKAGKIKKDKHESVIFRRDNSHYEKRGSEEVCIDDELPFEIPASWQWERLINIYNFIDYRGATPNKITSGVPLITAKNVKKGYIDYTIKDFISVEEYKNRQSRGISNKGDILFTTEAPLGNVAIADIEQFSAGQRLITFQQYSKEQQLNNELIMYFILSECFQKQLQDKSTGTTVKGIKADKLKRLFIPIPPQAEQSRILASIQLLVDKTSTL